MTVPPTSPSRNLRVFAKVAHAAPAGGASRRLAAVVRFHLKGGQSRGPLLQEARPPAAAPAVQKTFRFGELRAFLEAGTARAAVAGMVSLLPLDLEADCFQAWAGFISSVLGLAALRSRRRNLGGMIGIVRIDCSGAADGGNEGGRHGFPPVLRLKKRRRPLRAVPVKTAAAEGAAAPSVTKPCQRGWRWRRRRAAIASTRRASAGGCGSAAHVRSEAANRTPSTMMSRPRRDPAK